MPYRFLEEEAVADVAFEAWGRELEDVFRATADAVLNVMIENLDGVQDRERRTIELGSEALDLLLFDFLQRLIYVKDAERLLLRLRHARIERRRDRWTLVAETRGERLDPTRHRQRVDVKAVTLHEFRLDETDEGWRAHVVLDV